MAGKRAKKLSGKRLAFANAYLTNGFNATQAYKAAYGSALSDKTAGANGARLLGNASVREYLEAQQLKAIAKTEITVERIVEELAAIVTANLADGLNENGGAKSVSEWPDNLKRAMAGVEISEEWGPDAEGGGAPVGLLKKFKLWNKIDAADKLLRKMGAYAPDRHEHTVSIFDLVNATMPEEEGGEA